MIRERFKGKPERPRLNQRDQLVVLRGIPVVIVSALRLANTLQIVDMSVSDDARSPFVYGQRCIKVFNHLLPVWYDTIKINICP